MCKCLELKCNVCSVQYVVSRSVNAKGSGILVCVFVLDLSATFRNGMRFVRNFLHPFLCRVNCAVYTVKCAVYPGCGCWWLHYDVMTYWSHSVYRERWWQGSTCHKEHFTLATLEYWVPVMFAVLTDSLSMFTNPGISIIKQWS